MYMNMSGKNVVFALLAVGLMVACISENPKKERKPVAKAVRTVTTPQFSSDSAYQYIQDQVGFGPRVPNRPPHDSCAKYLQDKLKEFGWQVQVQKAKLTAFHGGKLRSQNIIAQFNPDSSRRILLCAHWDTRPFADRDSVRQNDPIDGANDGASGVGVLLEIARQIGLKNPETGVDIIFFDSEDYGRPQVGAEMYQQFSQGTSDWCLGSQYWAKNKVPANYRAKNGILLDMVGAKGATFLKEGISRRYAKSFLNKVWDIGAELGYGQYFVKRMFGEITDDHVFVNQAGIPCIDIIQWDEKRSQIGGFGKFHHTHKDNMDIIDKATLKAVGQTVITVVYRRI